MNSETKFKLITIIGLSIRKKHLNTVSFEKLKDKNYEVWDISNISDDIRNDKTYEDEGYEDKEIKYISDKQRLLNLISTSHKKSYFHVTRVFDLKLRKEILKKINECGFSIVEKHDRCDPISNNPNYIVCRVKYVLRTLKNTLLLVDNNIADYIFCPTKYYKFRRINGSIFSKVFTSQTVDFDTYTDSDSGNVGKDINYGVFLGQNLPHHVEVKNKYGKDWIDVEEYYKKMRECLNEMKEYFSLDKIFIAEHPNSKVEKVSDLWGRYRVFKNKTAELVKGSERVFAHCSRSIMFAVMGGKPVTLITMENFSKFDVESKIYTWASLLDTEPELIGGSYNANQVDESNVKIYDNIIDKYVSDRSNKSTNSYVFMYDKLREISDE